MVEPITYGNDTDTQVRAGRSIPYGRAGTSVVADFPNTAVNLCQQAGLDKQVIFKTPTFINTTEGYQKLDNFFAIGRKDTRDVFQVASDQYTIRQNLEVAADLDAITHGRGEFIAAGSLGGGRKVYFVADLGTGFDVGGGDQVRNQLLLTNFHNGSGALTAMILPLRMSCLNQLNIVVAGAKTRFKMVHKASIEGFADRAVEYFSQVEEYNQVFAAECKALSERSMTMLERDVFALQLLQIDPEALENMTLAGGQRRSLDELGRCLLEPTGFEVGTITRWSAFNAVAEWVDHTRSPRAQEAMRDEKRFEQSLYGVGADLKQRAWDLLTV